LPNKKQFISNVWSHYDENSRPMPWRNAGPGGVFDPYKILVSELMLQQTQVERVIPKFNEFIASFPSLTALAAAPLEDVLRLWSGLGYNRRAKYLHDIAKSLQYIDFPQTISELTMQKGIGHNTAAAVLVYSYNIPIPFVETNVRTALLYHFNDDESMVNEKQFLSLAEQVLDTHNPREWYWALMDYGSHMKKSGVKNLSRAKIHKKQSPFEGSLRQIRGRVLKELVGGSIDKNNLAKLINDPRLELVLADLNKEDLIEFQSQGLYKIAE